jgi:toxin ParE1/3/4
MKVIVSAHAKRDALNTYSYLVSRNPAAADRIIQHVERKIEQLREFPLIGPPRPRLAAGVRAAVVGTHLVLYKVDDEAVIVLRIIDGRMDVDEEFRH